MTRVRTALVGWAMLLDGCALAPLAVTDRPPAAAAPANAPAALPAVTHRAGEPSDGPLDTAPAAPAAPAAEREQVRQRVWPGEATTAPARARRAPADPTASQLEQGRRAGTLDAQAFRKLRVDAETAYQAQQIPAATEAFATLVEIDPNDGQAWLRLGNLYQRKPDIAAAARAYRRAADVRNDSLEQRAIRHKALLNLALLGLERTRQALNELDREPLEPVLARARGEAVEQLSVQERRANAALPRVSAAGAAAASAHTESADPTAQVPARGGAAASDAERRRRSDRAGGPLRRRPNEGEPPAVQIDYLQGQPRP